MLDIDKWPLPFQWAFGFGTALAGALMAWAGARAAKKPPKIYDNELERLRDQARDNTLKQEFNLSVGEAKEAMGLALSATRKSFYEEIRAINDKWDARIREVETHCASMEAEIRELQRRRRQT